MKYILWIGRNMAGIRWNTLVRIVVGITQVMLGLLMIWFSKQFIDVTIRTGSDQDVLEMVCLLVTLVVFCCANFIIIWLPKLTPTSLIVSA